MNAHQEQVWENLVRAEAICQLLNEGLPDDEVSIGIRSGKISSRANNLAEKMAASSTRPASPGKDEFRRVPGTNLEVNIQWDMRVV